MPQSYYLMSWFFLDDGVILKILEDGSKAFIISETHLCNGSAPVHSMKLDSEKVIKQPCVSLITLRFQKVSAVSVARSNTVDFACRGSCLQDILDRFPCQTCRDVKTTILPVRNVSFPVIHTALGLNKAAHHKLGRVLRVLFQEYYIIFTYCGFEMLSFWVMYTLAFFDRFFYLDCVSEKEYKTLLMDSLKYVTKNQV